MGANRQLSRAEAGFWLHRLHVVVQRRQSTSDCMYALCVLIICVGDAQNTLRDLPYGQPLPYRRCIRSTAEDAWVGV